MSIGSVIRKIFGVILVGGLLMSCRGETNQPLVQKATKAAIADMKNANASLPKWDNRNYKGLVHRPAK
jgi:hypothetical protein